MMEAISFMTRHASAKYMSMQRPLHIEQMKQTVLDRKKETIDEKMGGDIYYKGRDMRETNGKSQGCKSKSCLLTMTI